MSVLVKDMDMPKSCADCPCGDAQDGWCYVHNEVLERMENGYPSTETRPEWCPLVEVPTPHGDLIDRDVIRDNLMYEMAGTGYQSKAMKACDEYYTMTVIEAEE